MSDPSTAVATTDDVAVDGLEDFDSKKDASMPIIKIDHDEAVFTDTLSGESIGSEIKVILLGLVKQRVLWEAEMTEGKTQPLCRSYDFNVGHPSGVKFPVKAAGIPGITLDALEEGGVTIPCASCKLQEWGTHPKRESPWCSAQYTFAMLTSVGEGLWAPALITFQRTSLKPSNQYLTYFQTHREPLYTVLTTIKLDSRSRGTNDYAVPKFIRGEETDKEEWPNYSATFKGIRSFLQTPRDQAVSIGGDDDSTPVVVEEDPSVSGGDATDTAAPAASSTTDAGTPAPEPTTEPAPAVPDDDLPF